MLYRADLVTSYSYDGAGRRLTETMTAGAWSQPVTVNTYDMAGRLTSSADGQGIVTTYGYNGVISTTTRGGLTNTTVRYLDGQSKSSLENGVVKSASDYGVNTDGTRWAQAFAGSQGLGSPSWQKTTTDLLGRTVRNDNPASAERSWSAPISSTPRDK